MSLVANRDSIPLRCYAADGGNITSVLQQLVTESISSRRVLDVSGGSWVYNGPGITIPNGDFLAVKGSVAGKTRITNTGGGYLFDTPDRIGNLYMADFECSGGKGLLRQSRTGIDAAAGVLRSLERMRIVEHTECGVNLNVSDGPNWQFTRCWFDAASSTGTMDVAHAGLPNDMKFDGCEFGDAQVNVKLRYINDVNFVGCSFYRTAAADTGVPRINLWCVPSSSATNLYGNQLRIIGTKFGNEFWSAEDRKIVVADEGSGADVGTKFPVLDTASSGRLYAFHINGSKFQWDSSNPGPGIFSTTPNIGFMSSVFGNSWYGSATEAQADIPVIEWLGSLGIADQMEEFWSVKGSDGFYRHGPSGKVVKAAGTGWQVPV